MCRQILFGTLQYIASTKQLECNQFTGSLMRSLAGSVRKLLVLVLTGTYCTSIYAGLPSIVETVTYTCLIVSCLSACKQIIQSPGQPPPSSVLCCVGSVSIFQKPSMYSRGAVQLASCQRLIFHLQALVTCFPPSTCVQCVQC